jgi:hypothetical protein
MKKTKMYIMDRHSLDVYTDFVDLDNEEERDEFYEGWDESPMIGGTLFLTEAEYNALIKFKEVKNEISDV